MSVYIKKRGLDDTPIVLPTLMECDTGHRSVWFAKNLSCPVCEIDRYLSAVLSSVSSAKVVIDHIKTLMTAKDKHEHRS